jgi:hypothetical protein
LAVGQIAAARFSAAGPATFAASLATSAGADAVVAPTGDAGIAFELVTRIAQLPMVVGNRPHNIAVAVVESIEPHRQFAPAIVVAEIGGENVLRPATVEIILRDQTGLLAPGTTRPVKLVAPIVIMPAADATDVIHTLAAIMDVGPRPQRIEAPPRAKAPVAPRREAELATAAVVVAEEVIIGSRPNPQVDKEPAGIERAPRPIAEARL